jgi:hypothetical protein
MVIMVISIYIDLLTIMILVYINKTKYIPEIKNDFRNKPYESRSARFEKTINFATGVSLTLMSERKDCKKY